MNQDILKSAIRAVINWGAGALITHGLLVANSATTSAEEALAAALATWLSLLLSNRHQVAMKTANVTEVKTITPAAVQPETTAVPPVSKP